jgi:hypothetical protein
MSDDWSLKDKQYKYDYHPGLFSSAVLDKNGNELEPFGVNLYTGDSIDILRKKLIEDVLKIQDDLAKEGILYHLDTDDFQNRIISSINKRFGVEE